MLELSVYDGAPHLLAPVVTEPKKAVVALKWTVREMEDRYRKMSKMGVRNMAGYNEKVAEAKARGEMLTRTIMTGYDKETGEPMYETEELDFDPMQRYGGVGAGLDLSNGYLVVLQHPVTTEHAAARHHVQETLQAVADVGLPTLWFWPNPDAGSDGTSRGIRAFRVERGHMCLEIVLSIRMHL